MKLKYAAGWSFGLIAAAGGISGAVIAHYAEMWGMAFAVAIAFAVFGGLAVMLAIETT